MELLSIVIPSYNHAPYVAEAVRSAIELDYPSVELIIVDDGSTDGSPAVIRNAIKDHRGRRISFIEQENAGAPLAIMRGLSHARGDVLTILNSDDIYDTERFSHILTALPKTEDFIAFTSLRHIDGNGKPLSGDAYQVQWYTKAQQQAAEQATLGFALLRYNLAVTSSNLVFSRALYEKLGGFGDFKLCHDWDFLIRAMHYVEPICLDKTLLSYRIHPANTVNSSLHLFMPEGVPALNSYLALGLTEEPPNALAPGWTHWPRYFDHFITSHSSWFSDEPIGKFVADRPAMGRGKDGKASSHE